MKSRCYSETYSDYPRYGGRGIKIFKEWLENPETFYEWSINNGFKMGYQLDKIDNDGDYCPDNCQYLSQRDHIIKHGGNPLKI